MRVQRGYFKVVFSGCPECNIEAVLNTVCCLTQVILKYFKSTCIRVDRADAKSRSIPLKKPVRLGRGGFARWRVPGGGWRCGGGGWPRGALGGGEATGEAQLARIRSKNPLRQLITT